MEVTDKRAALLCNKEVLTVLQSYAREQKKNKRGDQNLSTITYETLKYLNDTPSAIQTEESIQSVTKSLAPYKLTKAEKLQLINLRPTTDVELSLIIEENEERLSDQQIEEVLEIVSRLPAPIQEEEEQEEEEEASEMEEDET